MRIVREQSGFYKVENRGQIVAAGDYVYPDHQSLNTVTISAGF